MDEINLSEYTEIVWRRRRLIGGFTAAALALAVILLIVLPKTYRGKAVLIFPQGQQSGAEVMSRLMGVPSLAGLSGPGKSDPGTYAEILRSRTLKQEVIHDLQLDSIDLRWDDIELVKTSMTKDGGMEIVCCAPTSWLKRGSLPWLDRRFPNSTNKRKAAVLAAEMTNTYLRRLQDFDRRYAFGTGRRHAEFLTGEVARTKRELARAEESWQRFKEQHPVVPPPDTADQVVAQVIAIRTKQIEAEAELSDLKQGAEEAKGVVADQQVVETAATVVHENPIVAELKSQLAQAEVQKAQLLENMSEKHPAVVAIDQQIAKTEDKIHREVAKVTQSETLQLNPVRQFLVQNLANLEIKQSGAQARLEALQEIMAKTERDLSHLAGDQLQYVRLMREVKALDNVYMALVIDLSQAKVNESKEPEGFTVLDWAVPEKHAFKPKKKLVILAALILGFTIGAFVAIGREGSRVRKRPSERSLETTSA